MVMVIVRLLLSKIIGCGARSEHNGAALTYPMLPDAETLMPRRAMMVMHSERNHQVVSSIAGRATCLIERNGSLAPRRRKHSLAITPDRGGARGRNDAARRRFF